MIGLLVGLLIGALIVAVTYYVVLVITGSGLLAFIVALIALVVMLGGVGRWSRVP